MAYIGIAFSETELSGTKASWSFDITGSNSVATGSTFQIKTPIVEARYYASNKGYGRAEARMSLEIDGTDAESGNLGWYWSTNGTYTSSDIVPMTSGQSYTLSKITSSGGGPEGQSHTKTLTTSNYFNASNKTTRSLSINAYDFLLYGYSSKANGTNASWGDMSSSGDMGTVAYVILNVPPTFTASSISYNTTDVCSSLTTASVTVSNATAYYGGDVSNITLTIGNQSVSRSTNGTLSIALANAGTFTPKITVTDSRGQVGTKTLPSITVNEYVPPSVSFNVDRSTSTGVPDEAGTYATAVATFIFSDNVANLAAPTVTLTDANGTTSTPTVTWYSTRASNGTLSGSVTWANLSSGATVYCRIPYMDANYAYQVSITPRDNKRTGTAITNTLPSAFYTVDFMAGGRGIAFGRPSSQEGFLCDMETTFMKNVIIDIPDYQTTGDIDKAIYDDIVSLGWDSVVDSISPLPYTITH